MSLFKLRGPLSKAQTLILGLAGVVALVLVWWLLAEALARQIPVVEGYNTRLPSSLEADSTGVVINRDSLLREDSIRFANAKTFKKVYPLLPPPNHVVQSLKPLVEKDALANNTLRSVWLNIKGYFWAIMLAVPIGFLIGLVPLFRGLFSKQVDALRYLPLTALTGLFIIWFGIEDQMKTAFLAFGILVYLLPVVVQRIDEVEDVYLTTVFTLGAGSWQTIRTVYLPAVFSKLIDDIRVLTAISWTYIIIAELLNREGGIGGLIYLKQRQGEVEKLFAILIIIILIGFIQDRIFVYLDRRLFPHKYYKRTLDGIKEVEYGIFTILGVMALAILVPMFLPSLAATLQPLAVILLVASAVIIAYGEWKVQRARVKVG